MTVHGPSRRTAIATSLASVIAAPAILRAQTRQPVTIVNAAGGVTLTLEAILRKQGYFEEFGLDATFVNVADTAKAIGALIGGAVAHSVFRGRVHIGYLAGIVAASNAGGSGSVVGDTTTTMMWIDGVDPGDVLHAYAGAIVALVVCGIPAALQQQRFSPIIKDAPRGLQIDWTSVWIVAAILVIESVFFVERKLKLDDPVGAISVHGVGGIFGVLCVGIFSNGSYGAGWNGSSSTGVEGIIKGDWGQLGAQALGAVVLATVIFGVAYGFFKIQNALTKGGIRSKEEDEIMGLDLPEMGVSAYPEFNLR